MSMSDTLIFTYLWVYEAQINLIKNEVNISMEKCASDRRNFCEVE